MNSLPPNPYWASALVDAIKNAFSPKQFVSLRAATPALASALQIKSNCK